MIASVGDGWPANCAWHRGKEIVHWGELPTVRSQRQQRHKQLRYGILPFPPFRDQQRDFKETKR